MNILFLGLGSFLSVAFIVLLFKGSKYDEMLKPLSGNNYPIKMIYSAGLALQDFKIARLRGKAGDIIRENCKLYYSKQYSEYYARIVWAQVLSYGMISLAVFFLIAGLMNDSTAAFFGLIGIFAGILSVYYFFTYVGEKVKERRDECEMEFPNAISKLALMVNSGVIVYKAWEMVAYGKEGVFYDLMKASCEDINSGKPLIDAVYEFGVKTNSEEIKKFTSAMIQSIIHGGGDLSQFLATQSSELWFRKRQLMLQKGEKAASALLMPIALMFLGVILVVLAAAMQSFAL